MFLFILLVKVVFIIKNYVNKMLIKESKLRNIISETIRQYLKEHQVLINNFDKISQLMEFNSDDDFYFVQITKRWKDNKDFPGAEAERQKGRADGTFNGCSWFLKSWRVHSADELMALKPEIVKWCEENNARAYITINTRSTKETDSFIKVYQSRYSQDDARYKHAEDIVPGQAKSGTAWRDTRLRMLVDVDTNDKKIWNEVLRMLKYYNIRVLDTYETPSGGLHIILNNKNNRNLHAFKRECEKFDNFKHMGRNALVHPNEDSKLILYSNVQTAGY